MKTLGLIGGMSWESTQHYYQLMNQYVRKKLGGYHSLEAILYSVDFARILALVDQHRWDLVEAALIELAQKLQTAGAHFLILTSNAIHKVFPAIEAAIDIPLLHIVDPTGRAIQKARFTKIGLLGTQVTMEEPFYKERLQNRYGIEAILPDASERAHLHRIIFEELTVGKVLDSSRAWLTALIEILFAQGAQGIILGCTELTLLVGPKDTPVPLFDTTALHAHAAVDWACGAEFS